MNNGDDDKTSHSTLSMLSSSTLTSAVPTQTTASLPISESVLPILAASTDRITDAMTVLIGRSGKFKLTQTCLDREPESVFSVAHRSQVGKVHIKSYTIRTKEAVQHPALWSLLLYLQDGITPPLVERDEHWRKEVLKTADFLRFSNLLKQLTRLGTSLVHHINECDCATWYYMRFSTLSLTPWTVKDLVAPVHELDPTIWKFLVKAVHLPRNTDVDLHRFVQFKQYWTRLCDSELGLRREFAECTNVSDAVRAALTVPVWASPSANVQERRHVAKLWSWQADADKLAFPILGFSTSPPVSLVQETFSNTIKTGANRNSAASAAASTDPVVDETPVSVVRVTSPAQFCVQFHLMTLGLFDGFDWNAHGFVAAGSSLVQALTCHQRIAAIEMNPRTAHRLHRVLQWIRTGTSLFDINVDLCRQFDDCVDSKLVEKDAKDANISKSDYKDNKPSRSLTAVRARPGRRSPINGGDYDDSRERSTEVYVPADRVVRGGRGGRGRGRGMFRENGAIDMADMRRMFPVPPNLTMAQRRNFLTLRQNLAQEQIGLPATTVTRDDEASVNASDQARLEQLAQQQAPIVFSSTSTPVSFDIKSIFSAGRSNKTGGSSSLHNVIYIVYLSKFDAKRTTERLLRNWFSPFGLIERVELHDDYAAIAFGNRRDAEDAVKMMDGKQVNDSKMAHPPTLRCRWTRPAENTTENTTETKAHPDSDRSASRSRSRSSRAARPMSTRTSTLRSQSQSKSRSRSNSRSRSMPRSRSKSRSRSRSRTKSRSRSMSKSKSNKSRSRSQSAKHGKSGVRRAPIGSTTRVAVKPKVKAQSRSMSGSNSVPRARAVATRVVKRPDKPKIKAAAAAQHMEGTSNGRVKTETKTQGQVQDPTITKGHQPTPHPFELQFHGRLGHVDLSKSKVRDAKSLLPMNQSELPATTTAAAAAAAAKLNETPDADKTAVMNEVEQTVSWLQASIQSIGYFHSAVFDGASRRFTPFKHVHLRPAADSREQTFQKLNLKEQKGVARFRVPDIDLFLVLSESELKQELDEHNKARLSQREKVADRLNQSLYALDQHIRSQLPPKTQIWQRRSAHAVTFCLPFPYPNVQVALRAYKSLEEVVLGGDLTRCGIGMDQCPSLTRWPDHPNELLDVRLNRSDANVKTTEDREDKHTVENESKYGPSRVATTATLPSRLRLLVLEKTRFALANRINIAESSRASTSYLQRLVKDWQRGMQIGLPGLNLSSHLTSTLLIPPFDQLPMVSQLLRYWVAPHTVPVGWIRNVSDYEGSSHDRVKTDQDYLDKYIRTTVSGRDKYMPADSMLQRPYVLRCNDLRGVLSNNVTSCPIEWDATLSCWERQEYVAHVPKCVAYMFDNPGRQDRIPCLTSSYHPVFADFYGLHPYARPPDPTSSLSENLTGVCPQSLKMTVYSDSGVTGDNQQSWAVTVGNSLETKYLVARTLAAALNPTNGTSSSTTVTRLHGSVDDRCQQYRYQQVMGGPSTPFLNSSRLFDTNEQRLLFQKLGWLDLLASLPESTTQIQKSSKKRSDDSDHSNSGSNHPSESESNSSHGTEED